MTSRLLPCLATLTLAAACNKPVNPPEPTPPPTAHADAGVLTPERALAEQLKGLPWSPEVIRNAWKAGLTLGYDVDAAPLKCPTSLRVVSCDNDQCAIELDRSACGTDKVPGPAKGVQQMPLAQALLAGATVPLGTKASEWKLRACEVLGKPAECYLLESKAQGTKPGEIEVLRTALAKEQPVVVYHFAGVERQHEMEALVTLKLTSMSGL